MIFSEPERGVLERFINESRNWPLEVSLDDFALPVTSFSDQNPLRELHERGILRVEGQWLRDGYSPQSSCYLTSAGRAEALKVMSTMR